ncbi:MAG: GntR family transcriptional regulator [Deltaproteobacteria bacterium]|jgi:DNA-binding GntR family transcriptional regulator|nr:GntR family transcriptional regulator [Deltaproteobacteria bacterium]
MERLPERTNLRDQIYDILKRRIVLRQIESGKKINEEDLAKSLGVSRTPIRETLLRLEHEGIVKIIPRRGAFVVSQSKEKVMDLFEVREVLEGLVAQLATKNMNHELLDRLKRCLEKISSGDGDNNRLLKYTPADVEFHATLLEASDNELLKSMMESVNVHLQMVRLRTVALPGRPEQTVKEHYEILAAIEKKNSSLAEKLMRKHVASVRRDALKNMPLMK